MCDKPVATFYGWMPNGVKTNVPVSLDGTPDDFDRILNYQNMFLSRGFVLDDPAFGKLEAGEGREQVGYIVRRSQKNNSDNTVTPVIDVYPTPEATKLKFMSIYLDTADDVLAFEKAFGLKLAALPVLPGKKSIERDEQDFTQYVIKVTGVVSAVYKANPRYNPEETDLTKKKPKRLFVKWETATPQPAAAPAAAPAVEIPTPVIIDDEAQRRIAAVNRYDNETVTIDAVTYQPTHNGSGKPCWEAKVRATDGTRFPITLWTEHVNTIRKAGYAFPTADSDMLAIDVVIEVVDGIQRMKAAVAPDGTMVAVDAPKHATTNPESIAWIFDKPMLFTVLGKQPEVAKIDYKERANTVNKMHTEGAFDTVANVEDAVKLVVKRLVGHHEEKKTA